MPLRGSNKRPARTTVVCGAAGWASGGGSHAGGSAATAGCPWASIGEGVAIPHGTLAGKDSVKKDAIVVLRFPDGVDWDGNDVRVCVGIAARGNGHIALLSQLAIVLLDPDKAAVLRAATTSAEVYELLKPDPQDGYSP